MLNDLVWDCTGIELPLVRVKGDALTTFLSYLVCFECQVSEEEQRREDEKMLGKVRMKHTCIQSVAIDLAHLDLDPFPLSSNHQPSLPSHIKLKRDCPITLWPHPCHPRLFV